MSELQSPQPQNTPGDSPVAETDGPQLRVVAAEPDGSPLQLEQFELALAGGDLSRARDALLVFRDEQRAERNRLQQEKTQLLQAVADLQQLLDDRCLAHENELQQQKQRLSRWYEQEKQTLAAEARQAMAEIQSAQDGFARECQQWERNRDAQTTQLAKERDRLESDTAELANQRAEFEASIAKEQQEQLRVTDELLAERETEWVARQKQLEHELKSQRQLHEKQIALDRESFLQACAERETELNTTRAELDRERQELVEDRCKSAERFADTRRQLEQDRSLVQNCLRKMESQLRWVSSSIFLSLGSPPAAESPVSAESQSGWTGLATPRDEPADAECDTEDDSSAASSEVKLSDEERRARLEDYRAQLTDLQASLSNIQSETSELDDDTQTS